MIDGLTILRCRPTGQYCCGDAEPHRHTAAKTHRWTGHGWETVGYRAGAIFDVYERDWSDFDGFADLLCRVARDPRSLIIRNKLKLGHPRLGVRRRFHDREECPAPFETVDRGWLCLDVDGAPDGGERYEELIPGWLHGVRHVAQLSSSAGIKPDTSVHLWFLLDRRVACASLKDYFKPWPHLDQRLLHPVQAHYIAHPIFIGAPDPIRDRIYILGGAERAMPPLEIVDSAEYRRQKQAEEAARRAAVERRRRNRTRSDLGPRATRALHRACDELLAASAGERHETITRKCYFIGGLVGAGRLDYHTAIDQLVAAAEMLFEDQNRRRDVRRIVEDTLKNGMRAPLHSERSTG